MEPKEFVEALEEFENRLKKLRDHNREELSQLHWDFYSLKEAVYRKVNDLPEPKPEVHIIKYSDAFPGIAKLFRFIKGMFTGVFERKDFY